jgi:hypothetical protein
VPSIRAGHSGLVLPRLEMSHFASADADHDSQNFQIGDFLRHRGTSSRLVQ